jgi:FAD/FMN-containing dehydrogenase
MRAIVRTDLATRARYAQGGGVHRILPVAVARPHHADALAASLAWARGEGVTVTPRGAGSSMAGAAVGPGLVIDLTAYDDGVWCRIDGDAGCARVSPSLTLGALAREAAVHGLRVGPDPSSSAWATIGGVIGTNAAGPRSHRLGAMHAWIESVTLLTGEGPLDLARNRAADVAHPVVRRFTDLAAPVLGAHRDAILARWPVARKNSFGYALPRYLASHHLLDVVIGAEGTLGIVTGATVRLERWPAHSAGLRVDLADRSDLPGVIAALDRHEPVAIELLDRSFLAVVDSGRPAPVAVLLVEFEDAEEGRLGARLEAAAALVRAAGHVAITARDERARAALWAVRHEASPALARLGDGRHSLQVIEDGCVPVEHLARYLDAVDAVTREHGVEAVMFGHAGDGHVHVNLLPDVSEHGWLGRVEAILEEVTETVIALGGTPAGEHGVGRLRAPLLERVLGPEAVRGFQAIRDAFDPEGLWHRGVIIPDGHPALARLKVGADAVPLPAAVEAELRGIEQERRWGERRWR